MIMNRKFHPGDVIGGFCQGFFGRDDYEEKTCVVVWAKFAVFIYEDGTATILNSSEQLENADIDSWRVK